MHSMLSAPGETVPASRLSSRSRGIARLPAFAILLVTVLGSVLPSFGQAYVTEYAQPVGPIGMAIDSVGGETLAGLTRHMDFWGNIASVGLAGGAELKTTVMPFILRGVNLLGINSSATPRAERLQVWQRIAGDLKPRHLERIVSRTIAFAELPGAFQAYIDGQVTGRTVVKIG